MDIHRARPKHRYSHPLVKLNEHVSCSEISPFFPLLPPFALSLITLTSVRQMMMREKVLTGHGRPHKTERSKTKSDTHTNRLWFPNMSVCNPNIPLETPHTAQRMEPHAELGFMTARWVPRHRKCYYTWREERSWGKEKQLVLMCKCSRLGALPELFSETKGWQLNVFRGLNELLWMTFNRKNENNFRTLDINN